MLGGAKSSRLINKLRIFCRIALCSADVPAGGRYVFTNYLRTAYTVYRKFIKAHHRLKNSVTQLTPGLRFISFQPLDQTLHNFLGNHTFLGEENRDGTKCTWLATYSHQQLQTSVCYLQVSVKRDQKPVGDG